MAAKRTDTNLTLSQLGHSDRSCGRIKAVYAHWKALRNYYLAGHE